MRYCNNVRPFSKKNIFFKKIAQKPLTFSLFRYKPIVRFRKTYFQGLAAFSFY